MLCHLKSLLAHPLTKGLALDDPRTTELRAQIIQSKPFLRRIYADWYRLIQSRIPPGDGRVLEIGSGGGCFGEFVPEAVRSELFFCPNVHVVTDARELPFASGSLKAIAMTDVFHHIPQSESFLKEALRCLVPGGRIIMVEPWVCAWSKLVYSRFHHEPFQPQSESWDIPPTGPLSGANGALPWIVFVRDRKLLSIKFPELEIETIEPMMPLRYLLSGGVSMRSLVPGVLYGPWRALEKAASHWNHQLGMFALFCIRKIP
jgi:SAM-dependent methyltransferase